MGKPPNRWRKVRKQMYFSYEEWEKIERRMAEANHPSFSDFARHVLCDEPFEVREIISVPHHVLNELGAIGNNINQMAWNANARHGTTREDVDAVAAQVEKLWMLLTPFKPKGWREF